MHPQASAEGDEITIQDAKGNIDTIFDPKDTSEHLMSMNAERLYVEAELFFYEFLSMTGVVIDERDYRENFSSVFASFMRGEAKSLPEVQSLNPKDLEVLRKLHSGMIGNPLAERLYIHCQMKTLAYLLRVGIIKSQMQYIEGGFSHLFSLMSTGAITHPQDPENLHLSAFSEEVYADPGVTQVHTQISHTQLRAFSV